MTQRKHTLPISSDARKEVPVYRGVLRYFPAALAAAARVSKVGNDKHNPGEEMHHARGKSTDHGDCIIRHLMDLEEDYGHGKGYDDQGLPQVGYIVWRACALAQQWLEDHEGAPLAPGAKLPQPAPASGTEIDARPGGCSRCECVDCCGDDSDVRASLDAFYDDPEAGA